MLNKLYKNLEKILKNLDKSNIFLAIVFLLHSVGSKYIEQQVSEGIKQLLQNPWSKSILIFSSSFIITRNCKVSLVTAGIGFIIFRVFLQDDSAFCIVSKKEN